jgi:hypothetical protein
VLGYYPKASKPTVLGVRLFVMGKGFQKSYLRASKSITRKPSSSEKF